MGATAKGCPALTTSAAETRCLRCYPRRSTRCLYQAVRTVAAIRVKNRPSCFFDSGYFPQIQHGIKSVRLCVERLVFRKANMNSITVLAFIGHGPAEMGKLAPARMPLSRAKSSGRHYETI